MSNFFSRLLNYSSSSDEEERNMWFAAAIEYERQNSQGAGSGDRISRQYRHRDRVSGHSRLLNDYFVENPVYDETLFRRRFRLSRPLFLRILHTLQQRNQYFVQRRNAANTLGLSGEQKMTAALRMLAYGMAADSLDEYVRIGETTTIECVKRFCQGVGEIFGPEYLRSPNAADISRLLWKANQRGFPGMLGSLDCMHWAWKNYPAAYHGMYTGHVHRPTIVLEAVASYDLWIWHAFFGMPGSNNDINVLDASNLFANLREGCGPPADYTIMGNHYNMGYYLADGIYPKWATIVQSITHPQDLAHAFFANKHESYRKDVERALGVLQARFAIVRGPARFWHHRDLSYIMKACIILHNMIIEDERVDDNELVAVAAGNEDYDSLGTDTPVEVSQGPIPFDQFMARNRAIRDLNTHYALRNDIITHLWTLHGQGVIE